MNEEDAPDKTVIRAEENNIKLRRAICFVEELLTEAHIKFKEDKIQFKGSDPSMIGLIDLEIKAEEFKSYSVREDIKGEWRGVNISNLATIVRKCNKKDALELEYWAPASEFKIYVEKDNLDMEWTLPNLNLSRDEIPTIAELKPAAKTIVDADSFRRAVNCASIAGDGIEIMVDMSQERDLLYAEGDKGEFEAFVQHVQEGKYLEYEDGKSAGSGISMFSKDYLEIVGKIAPDVENLVLKTAQDFPITIEVDEDHIEFQYVIAPKIEDE